MTTTLKPITARRKLDLSQLSPRTIQQEAMGDDLDFDKFVVYLNGLIQIKDLSSRITAAPITRTIEGASTLSVTVNDYDRQLLQSDILNKKLDVEIDGLWFRYTGNDKSGDNITLTFEDREIAILRTYHSWKIANRDQMTRAEFILSMLREVKEYKIPFVIPELSVVQPIAKYDGDLIGVDQIISKGRGISPSFNSDAKNSFNHRDSSVTKGSTVGLLTVKGAEATPEQINNANIILQVADSLGVDRNLKLVAIMAGIQESTLHNLPGGDNAHGGGKNDSAGLFQQDGGWGSYPERTNPEAAAGLFFNGTSTGIAGAIKVQQELGNVQLWVIAANVQHPAAKYESLYAKWRNEAEKFVNAYGDTGGSVTSVNNMNGQVGSFSNAAGSFYYWRGNITDKNNVKIRKPENTWDCYQRLADEVDYRAFFVSGVFYYISEKDLFQQLPAATITEFQDGIDVLDGEYDRAKKAATITVEARVGRWVVPPGSVVIIQGMGHYDGRWLVNEYTRDLIGANRTATITLKKPRPALPEPAGHNDTQLATGWAPGGTTAPQPAPSRATSTAILENSHIHFNNTKETTDITLGAIDERILNIMLWLVNQGYDIQVSALKSDHSPLTSEGRISAHGSGRAVDIQTFNLTNPDTPIVMKLLAANQPLLGFDQLIGPYPMLCIPRGVYDAKTLSEHLSHIHIGVPGTSISGHG